MTQHDRLFKELLQTFFAEFLELFAADIAQELDGDTVEFLDREIFTDVTAGETLEPDLVARVRLHGIDSRVLIHLEHQAQAQVGFERRMYRYFARLYEKHDVPILLIALFSHGTLRPEPDRHVVTVQGREVLKFSFQVIQLNRLDWRKFARNENPVAAALMTRMKFRREERPRVKLECLRLVVSLGLDRARVRLLSGFVDTYLRLNEAEQLKFREAAISVLPINEHKKVMELTTSWKEEGRLEGRREGQASVLQQLLSRRFGALPPKQAKRIRALSPQQLGQLAEAILDFHSPADLEAWLQRH